jgi:uncharacterized MAPEG superfamily protein
LACHKREGGLFSDRNIDPNNFYTNLTGEKEREALANSPSRELIKLLAAARRKELQ